MIRARLGIATLLLATLAVMAGCASRPPKATGGAHSGSSSYTVKGHTYHVRSHAAGFRRIGEASWYGPGFNGRSTASGQIYDMHQMTAAQKTLPLGSRVRVTDLANGRHVVVRINDRGPFHGNRIIDLSYAAAKKLHMVKNGRARVQIVAAKSDGPVSSKHTGNSKQHESEPAHKQVASAHGHYLQAGAFKDQNHAERQKRRIRNLGINQIQVRHATSGRRLYHVRIGPFATTSARQRVRQNLRADGVSTVVRND